MRKPSEKSLLKLYIKVQKINWMTVCNYTSGKIKPEHKELLGAKS